jgi:hypothetical protein
VATVADICLAFAEQAAVRFRLVNRMARGANDIGLRVIAAPDVRPVLIFRMATQAGIQSLAGCQLRKGHDRVFPALRIHMLLARAMATFASSFVEGRVGQDTSLVMWVPEKLERHIRVTRTAGIAAGVGIVGSG